MEPVVLQHDWYDRPMPTNVAVGERCWVHSAYAFLHYHSTAPLGVSIGNDTGVYLGTYFELGAQGRVEIGKYCSMVGVIIRSNSRVVIGDYTFIAHKVIMADSPWAVPPGNETTSARSDPLADIIVGNNVWIGAEATLLGGTRLGEGVIVGAGSVVNGEFPPFAIVAGNPARIVGWTNPGESLTRELS